MRISKRRLSAGVFALVLAVGMLAPASAAHNGDHDHPGQSDDAPGERVGGGREDAPGQQDDSPSDDAGVQPSGDAVGEDGKVYVCKYVSVPGENERLKDGRNPIHVDANTLRNTGLDITDLNVGDSWTDAHERSELVDGPGDCPLPDDPDDNGNGNGNGNGNDDDNGLEEDDDNGVPEDDDGVAVLPSVADADATISGECVEVDVDGDTEWMFAVTVTLDAGDSDLAVDFDVAFDVDGTVDRAVHTVDAGAETSFTERFPDGTARLAIDVDVAGDTVVSETYTDIDCADVDVLPEAPAEAPEEEEEDDEPEPSVEADEEEADAPGIDREVPTRVDAGQAGLLGSTTSAWMVLLLLMGTALVSAGTVSAVRRRR